MDRKTFADKVNHQLYRHLCSTLRLPQRAAKDLALEYCQMFWLEVHQNWEDGYSVEDTLNYLNQLIEENKPELQKAA